jgi:hypothetical protein
VGIQIPDIRIPAPLKNWTGSSSWTILYLIGHNFCDEMFYSFETFQMWTNWLIRFQMVWKADVQPQLKGPFEYFTAKVQWGSEYRTPKYRKHLNSGHLQFWLLDGSN